MPSFVVIVVALLFSSAALGQQPTDRIPLGNAGGYRLEAFFYASGSSRCQGMSVGIWGDGARGERGAEIHFASNGAIADLTYWISKSTWQLQNDTRMNGTLRFSSGPMFNVAVRAVGTNGMRITAPVESFGFWRLATRAYLRLENGFNAYWELDGTNAAGGILLDCVRVIANAATARDPMRPASRPNISPTPEQRNPMASGAPDAWVIKRD